MVYTIVLIILLHAGHTKSMDNVSDVTSSDSTIIYGVTCMLHTGHRARIPCTNLLDLIFHHQRICYIVCISRTILCRVQDGSVPADGRILILLLAWGLDGTPIAWNHGVTFSFGFSSLYARCPLNGYGSPAFGHPPRLCTLAVSEPAQSIKHTLQRFSMLFTTDCPHCGHRNLSVWHSTIFSCNWYPQLEQAFTTTTRLTP